MHHEKRRLVDLEERTQPPKPMKVLCLGMCRTGTKSLLTAMNTLGYNPLHMSLIWPYPRKLNLWIEALEHTFVDKRPETSFGRPEFDVLLGDHDAVLDVPCAVFAEQLVKAYPDAKVILTSRTPQSWITSMQGSVWQIVLWPSFQILRYLDLEFMGPYVRLVELIFWVHNNNVYGGEEAEAAFVNHNNRVRELVPADQLLEFEAPYGWEKLCAFLDQPVPPEPYPRINETSSFAAKMYVWRNKAVSNVFRRMSKVLIFLVPAASCIWYFSR